MTLQDFYEYFKHITSIEAQEMLLRLKVQDWPNTKEEDRTKLWNKLSEQAHPSKKKKTLTNKELFDILNKR